MKQIQVLTLEVNHKKKVIVPHVRLIDSDNVLSELYRIIGCALVEVVQVEVEGKFYDVYCDEEFLLKEKPVPTLFLNAEQILCGNLVFTTCDEDGKLGGVTEEDIDKLIDFILVQAVKLRIYLAK